MANNRIQAKRTAVAGRTPNTTNAGNLQYIAAGEFAVNMTDQMVFTSDGTNLIYVGANQVNQRITNSLTVDNDKNIYFKTVNTSASVGFRQQSDDNFVFYSTNTTYGSRAIWAVFANSDSSNLTILAPLNIETKLGANGSFGSAGQYLTSGGTGNIYWTTPGAVSVNTDAQYIWTNTHTFQNTITFSSNVAVGANVIVNTSMVFVGNSTVNADMTSSLVQVANSTSTANLTAADLKIGATTVVNSSQITATLAVANLSGSYANITGQVNTGTLYAATSANIASALLANSTGIFPTSNAIGYSIGNSTARVIIQGNTASFGGLVTAQAGLNVSSSSSAFDVPSLTTGYAQIGGVTQTGYILIGRSTNNQTVAIANGATISGNVKTIEIGTNGAAGSQTNITVGTGLSNTLITVNANNTLFSGLVNAATYTTGAGFGAATTGATVNATTIGVSSNTTVNTSVTSITVQVANSTATSNLTAEGLAAGANVVANTTTLKVGNTTITTTNASFGGTLAANGSIGTAGQVLTSGAAGNVYWSTVSGGSGSTNVDATYVWTNVHTFNANVTFASTSNVGIGAVATNFARLYTEYSAALNSGNYNTYMYYGDSNGTMTAARTKVGFDSQISNFNQNKSSDGLTTYDAYYYASLGEAYSGSSASSQNAYAYEMTGGKFTMYHYANGSGSNTINNARGIYGQVYLGGTNAGVVNNAYGAMGQIWVPSSTITGTVNAAYGVYAGINSNTGFTINNRYIFYGSAQGTATANTWGIYLAGASNNYITGNTYFNGNVGIGQVGAGDTLLRMFDDASEDFSTYGIFNYVLNSNSALTAARSRYGFQHVFVNLSQNKDATGVTNYSTNYRAVVGDAQNGNTTSGGDARANEMIGGNFRVYNYATGSTSNTISTARGAQNQVWSYGSGIITTAYGTSSFIGIGNTTATGNITTAYGSYSEVQSNTAATIATGYLYYGQHTGATTTTKYGLYLTGEANNYLSGNFKLQGTSYLVGNVGIGVTAQTDTQLQSGITWTSDAALWNQYNGTTDSNVTTTAARTKYGFQSSISIQNQNKSADGLTQYQPTYRAVDARIYHGSTSTGGDAYAEDLQAVRAAVYLYANGATANGANTVRGVYNYIQHAGGGNVNSIHGVYAYFEPTNNSVTGTVANVTMFNAYLGGNTGVTIANGYLFKGDYSNSNRPAVAYGLHITDEANNYLSNTLFIGSTLFINTTAFDVGNTVISTTNATFGGTIAANGGIGTAGQVLTSGGAGNVYWATAAGGGGSVNVDAQYIWTNNHNFTANVTIDGSPVIYSSNFNMLRTGSFVF